VWGGGWVRGSVNESFPNIDCIILGISQCCICMKRQKIEHDPVYFFNQTECWKGYFKILDFFLF
jgi:hypothetical protein